LSIKGHKWSKKNLFKHFLFYLVELKAEPHTRVFQMRNDFLSIKWDDSIVVKKERKREREREREEENEKSPESQEKTHTLITSSFIFSNLILKRVFSHLFENTINRGYSYITTWIWSRRDKYFLNLCSNLFLD